METMLEALVSRFSAVVYSFRLTKLHPGATGANADSSRSHAIFQIVLKHKGTKNKIQGIQHSATCVGKIVLICE